MSAQFTNKAGISLIQVKPYQSPGGIIILKYESGRPKLTYCKLPFEIEFFLLSYITNLIHPTGTEKF